MMANPPSEHPTPPNKSSLDEGSDHKSKRETMRGDVPRFALPRMAFERKKELESDILIWL